MTNRRSDKCGKIAEWLPEQELEGPDSGELLVISWGGTYGSVLTAVRNAQADGLSVSHCHLRYLNPFPRNLGSLISSFKQVLIPELNDGQLIVLLRSKFLVDAKGLNKVKGKPFLVSEITEQIRSMLGAD